MNKKLINNLSESEEQELLELNEQLEQLVKRGCNDENLIAKRQILISKKFKLKYEK